MLKMELNCILSLMYWPLCSGTFPLSMAQLLHNEGNFMTREHKWMFVGLKTVVLSLSNIELLLKIELNETV